MLNAANGGSAEVLVTEALRVWDVIAEEDPKFRDFAICLIWPSLA